MAAQMSQLSLAIARQKGEDAMHAAADHAERVNPGWKSMAFLFVAKWAHARRPSDRFTAEDFVDEYMGDSNLLHPDDERSFGEIVKKAIAKGIIAYADHEGRRRKGHGARCDRYKSLISGAPWTAVVARMEL
jgi:hypothetical protein